MKRAHWHGAMAASTKSFSASVRARTTMGGEGLVVWLHALLLPLARMAVAVLAVDELSRLLAWLTLLLAVLCACSSGASSSWPSSAFSCSFRLVVGSALTFPPWSLSSSSACVVGWNIRYPQAPAPASTKAAVA